MTTHASVLFLPDFDGVARGRACAAYVCMNVITPVFARIRFGNFDWLRSHSQLLPHVLDTTESAGKLG